MRSVKDERPGRHEPEFEALAQLLARVRTRVLEDELRGGATPARATPGSTAPGKSEGPLLLRVEEVAKTLAIGRTQVYRLIASGDLPTVRIGRLVRISAEDLREWVRRKSR